MTKRVSITLLYDRDGIVDDYMIHFMQSMAPFMERMIIVSNGNLETNSKRKLEALTSEIIERENTDYDVGAYKRALSYIGYENLANYDELILYNYTNFGPIFPFSEIFSTMEKRKDDFWGMSIYQKEQTSQNGKYFEIPEHINSFFLAIRKPILSSPEFKKYWDNLGSITSYDDCIKLFEIKFTQYFHNLGFSYSSYIDPKDYEINYSLYNQVDKAIKNRAPVLKRRLFFNTPFYNIEASVNLRDTLQEIKTNSDYDLDLIWKNITRTTDAYTYHINSANLSILNDNPLDKKLAAKKIAIIIHICDQANLLILQDYLDTLNDFDIFLTIDPTLNDTFNEIINLKKYKNINVILKDIDEKTSTYYFLKVFNTYIKNKNYDYVARINFDINDLQQSSIHVFLHQYFLKNMISSQFYINKIFDLFENNESIGIITPSICHYTGPTWYEMWDKYKTSVFEVLKKLNIKIPVYEKIPVAPYYGALWFRPHALEALLEYEWPLQSFYITNNKQRTHISSASIELSMSYYAQGLGYITHFIMNDKIAELNYNALEFKYQAILGASSFKNLEKISMYINGQDIGLRSRAARKELQRAFKHYVKALQKSFLNRFRKNK